MITVAKIPFQSFAPNPKHTSNFLFSREGVNCNLGFTNNRGCSKLWWVGESGEMKFIRRWKGGCFVGCGSKKRKVEVESVNGGEDIFYATAAEEGSSIQPDHLVIMVNGIIGSAADWRYAAEQFVKNLPDKVIVHRSECNPSRLTFDGVDRMGERLAEEVIDVIQRWQGVCKISFVAHSLGGLVARYAIGKLYNLSAEVRAASLPGYGSHEEAKIFAQHLDQCFETSIGGLEPMNFVTFATPHLGSRGHKQLPFLCGLPFLEKSASQTAHLIAGRSGKHLFLTDNDDGRPPLLLWMVNDSGEVQFMSALRSFKRRVAYANANYDRILLHEGLELVEDGELHQFAVKMNSQRIAEDGFRKASSAVGTQVIDLEEEMIRGLNQVSWERVDVSFHKSNQRYVAHNTIQVKSYWLNSDGADVVQHMIDSFLL